MEHQRGVHVLGNGVGLETAALFEGGAAEDSPRAAEERGVPLVLAGADEIEEHVLFAVHPPDLPVHAMLQRVHVVVALRHLHERDLRIAEEAERAVEEIDARHMIRVERGDERAARLPERIVPIARLRVLVGRAREVMTAKLVGQRLHLRPTSIVEDVGRVGIAHRHRAAGGLTQQIDFFVVRGDEDVDGDVVRCQRHGPATQLPGLEKEEEE